MQADNTSVLFSAVMHDSTLLLAADQPMLLQSFACVILHMPVFDWKDCYEKLMVSATCRRQLNLLLVNLH